jgi:hypothetical protein
MEPSETRQRKLAHEEAGRENAHGQEGHAPHGLEQFNSYISRL